MQLTSAPETPVAKPRRGHWPLRDYPSIFWLVAGLGVLAGQRYIAEATWLMVHLVMLGALTHAIMVWSQYFSEALLKVPATASGRRAQSAKIATMILGAALVLVGYPQGARPVVIAGAVLVGFAVTWHAATIIVMMRRALPSRFRVTMHHYLLAALCLVAGATFGTLLADTSTEPMHGRLLMAHTMTNLLGWVGMTVVGTLITFWPTLLRTKMDPHADRAARIALPVFATALVIIDAGALSGHMTVAAAGLAVYLAGLLIWGRVIVIPFRAKPPREFASASVACALVWAVVGLAWVGVLVVRAGDWAHVSAGYGLVAMLFVGGFAAQLLVGALSYLIPTVVGGGPSVVRASLSWFNRWTTARLVMANSAVVLTLLSTVPSVRIFAAGVAGGCMVIFLYLMYKGILAGVDAKRVLAAGGTVEVPEHPTWSAPQLVAALTVLALGISAGVGLDPEAAGLSRNTDPARGGSQYSTGQTVRVQVKAVAMSYEPSSVTINAGDRLIIELVNETPSMVHDLSVLGRTTPRLATGETAVLDLGVVNQSTQGYCTVTGHRAAGMVFDVVVNGSVPGQSGGYGHDHSSPKVDSTTALGGFVDPVLPPLVEETIHRVTIDMTEAPMEVAPGVWQNRWMFNGHQVGPTLHGRVGDVFEITLINSGTMGHSIDFHASEIAPDQVMRTIGPGEQLTYTFTANRAGIWMYHCGTAPVSSHIAAGMHGAVVIDPPGLPGVDHEYVMVQSEIFMAPGSGSAPDRAAEVDSDKAMTKQEDYIVFNGIAFQYKQFPIKVRVGERVRFWVLDAGPNLASSFHVVGAQWDTVYFEGGYQLVRGRDAFGNTGGGAQALGLQAAQGGFVETVFTQPGHYTMVSHIFGDAERGALGIIEVTQ